MKYAYLIAAHNEYLVLNKLIETLDDENNDIYIHVDQKATDFQEKEIYKVAKKSRITFINRRSVTWGGYSQIQLELDLLKASTETFHDYYHFISGVDFPIKDKIFIDDFFIKNYGMEFIHYDDFDSSCDIKYRINQYHLNQEKIGRTKGFLKLLDNVYVNIQKLCGVSRMKKYNLEYKKGANWFSITHECALFILENEQMIKKMFSKSICADELFVQTIVYNSKFKERLYVKKETNKYSNMRYVDWKRGNPYIFKKEDYDELISNENIFARKFSSNIDIDIINMLMDR